ncbi:MAG: hypothetical protein RMA76_16860 [Deltaproteobacteria bacterium]|jgi:hypothetical protein
MGRAPVRGAVDTYRVLVAVVMLGVLVATMSWLQSRFDSSDHDKAVELVKGYKPQGGQQTLLDALLARHPGRKRHEFSWRSEIMSSCLGHVRVHARLPEKGDEPEVAYAFDVDLTAPSIHPTDPVTIEVLKSLTTATSTKAS